MQFKIFISSVQCEFAAERKLLADYIRKDAMMVPLLHRRHRSIPVNPLLARGMFYRGYIEKVGSGTGDMLEKCRLAGTPEPEWIEEDDGFTVILKRQTSQVGLEDIPAAIQKTPRKPPGHPPENHNRDASQSAHHTK